MTETWGALKNRKMCLSKPKQTLGNIDKIKESRAELEYGS